MIFRSYVPGAPLSAFVDDLWLYESYVAAHQREHILPSGTFEMVFSLREDELRIYDPARPEHCRRFSGALVSGPYTKPFMSDTVEEAAIMGVHFKAGGASAVLGQAAGALADAHVDLSTFWGPAARELRERLCALSDPQARFRLLEKALLERLTDFPQRHGAVAFALNALVQDHGRTRVRDIAREVGLSQRRLVDLFTAQVGLPPKLFGRIQRFQRATALAHRSGTPGWAQIAVDCGYFDQPHLIHEFVEFAGVRPADFHRRQRQLQRAGAHVKRHHLPLAG